MHIIARLLTCFVLVLPACSQGAIKLDQKLVLATIRPYGLIAKEISGSRLRVETLLPVSASPHTWSPRPSDVQRISQAALIVANGMGLELKLGSLFKDHALRTIFASDLVHDQETAAGELDHAKASETKDDKHQHGAKDPHLWTDPLLMVQFADVLAKRFEIHDPAGGSVFKKNFISFSNHIMNLDREFREKAAGYSKKAVVTFHDAFPRFFMRYGIERVAVLMATPGREPSVRELAELGKIIQAAGVRALYNEPQMDTKSVRVLAKEYNLPMLTLDPLGVDATITNYEALLRYNWGMLVQGFVR